MTSRTPDADDPRSDEDFPDSEEEYPRSEDRQYWSADPGEDILSEEIDAIAESSLPDAGAIYVVSEEGLCGLCHKPLDDHEGWLGWAPDSKRLAKLRCPKP